MTVRPAQMEVITCPNCESVLNRPEESRFVCQSCDTVLVKDASTQFFDFQINKRESSNSDPTFSNEKSLLENQESHFDLKEPLKRFSLETSTNELKSFVAEETSELLVDVGCGGGANALVFKGSYGTYIGLDPSRIPEECRLKEPVPENVILITNDPSKPLPIKDSSVDLVTMIASYDHVPERGPLIRDIRRILKPGGKLMIYMTNYGFWLKRTVNFLTQKKLFLNEHEHFCVHNVRSLVEEVQGYEPGFKLVKEVSNRRFVPSLPKPLSKIYATDQIVRGLNSTLYLTIDKLLKQKQSGAEMLVVFEAK